MTIVFPGTYFRMKTGPLAFGSDWPGVFIRGDDAQAFAQAIRFQLANSLLKNSVLEELADLLESCCIKTETRDDD